MAKQEDKLDLNKLVELIKTSNSWDEFKDKVGKLSDNADTNEPGIDLSDFNKKLKQGLEWNPKEHKK